MATKNYLDYTGLTTYDGLIKDYIGDNTGDSKNVTWEEYSQLPESEKKNSNIAYYITGVPDEESKKGYLGTASGELCTFTDGSDLPMPKLEVAIEPVQDLHGYDAPWVGGAGKNKLQVTATTQTINGVTFTVNNDGTIIVNGTATADARFVIGEYILKAGSSVRLNGSPVDGSNSTIALGYQGYGIVSTANSDRVCDRTSASTDWDNDVYINVTSGYTANNLTFKPMIRLESVTDATFAPYSNICPISGWDEVNVTRCGKNLFDKNNFKFIASGYIDGNSGQWTGSTTIREYPTDSLGNYWNSPLIDVTPLKGKTITYNGFTSASGVARGLIDKNFNVLTLLGSSSVASGTIDLSQYPTAKYLVLSFVKSDYSLDSAQVEIGSNATSYTPYNGQTITLDLDGTRYGGKVDLVSGVLTVDRAIVTFDGSSDETISEYSASSYRYRLWISEYRAVAESVLDTKLICSKLKTYTKNNLASDSSILYGLSPSDASSAYIIVKANGITNLADFKTWLSQNELQVVYELATPLTIQLPPTVVKSLRGKNNVFADSGNILDLEYWRSGNVQLRMNDYVIAGGNTVAYADVAENIIQTLINTDSEYRILFSGSDDNTTKADSVGKNGGLLYNPNKNAITLGTRASSSVTGGGSFVLGGNNTASGNGSFIHGVGCTASGNVSHAIGAGSVASGNVSFAQGSGVTASGDISHAEGTNTEASNDNAHAEGYHSLASGPVSHAEGSHTVASGNISHAEGIGTIAQRAFNHVFGKYNVADTGGASTTGTGTYIEIVGNGTNDTTGRSNARTLDWNGNETLAGNLVLGGTNSDITLSGSGNTWDGTNTSLKQAITAAASSGGVVTQTASDSEVDYYELLFSSTADNTTRIESTRKAQSLLYSPSSRELRITNSDNSSMTKITNGNLEVKYNGSTNTPARAELSVSSAVSIGDGFTGTVQLNDTTGKFMMIGSKNILLVGTGNTWDGTNTSLKDAITALSNRITALGG